MEPMTAAEAHAVATIASLDEDTQAQLGACLHSELGEFDEADVKELGRHTI